MALIEHLRGELQRDFEVKITPDDVFEACLFCVIARHRDDHPKEALVWAFEPDDILRPAAHRILRAWRHEDYVRSEWPSIHQKKLRAAGAGAPPAGSPPAASVAPVTGPDREEMELAICQALGLVELLTEKALAATKENGSCLAVRTDSGLVELSSNTCRRLRAAFYGRAA
jgi:hypothetical protein